MRSPFSVTSRRITRTCPFSARKSTSPATTPVTCASPSGGSVGFAVRMPSAAPSRNVSSRQPAARVLRRPSRSNPASAADTQSIGIALVGAWKPRAMPAIISSAAQGKRAVCSNVRHVRASDTIHCADVRQFRVRANRPRLFEQRFRVDVRVQVGDNELLHASITRQFRRLRRGEVR